MSHSFGPKQIHASGKLMLTGEYAVLDGALAWAVPTVLGQNLSAIPSPGAGLKWQSTNSKGEAWFRGLWDSDGKLLNQNDIEVAETLHRLLMKALDLNSNPFGGWSVETQLEFPNAWGLGSSSSLVALLAHWLEVNPHELFYNTLTGSGYDVAVAYENAGVLFQLHESKPEYEITLHHPTFADQLYFAYSGKKQNSQREVKSYSQLAPEVRQTLVDPITELTKQMHSTENFHHFCRCMSQHEEILGTIMEGEVLQNTIPNLSGTIKHLGAWGGDFFLLATEDSRDLERLKAHGITTIFNWNELIL
ncbi:MAG: hypothetical protein EP346_01355 [Bacteroidetes bacterium]|nr:MAG: hypothetical protein EP346_01355 [Bacteroidota bacterium]